jgi:hypothetical protein
VQDYCRELAETVEQQEQQGPPYLVRHPGIAALRGIVARGRRQGADHGWKALQPDEATCSATSACTMAKPTTSGSDLPPAQVQ